jgi:hypothetical protein
MDFEVDAVVAFVGSSPRPFAFNRVSDQQFLPPAACSAMRSPVSFPSAPSRAKARAMALPIPLSAPATSATRSLSLPEPQ